MNFSVELSEEDIETLQAAVENLRANPEGDDANARRIDAAWHIAFCIEVIAKRAEVARRAKAK